MDSFSIWHWLLLICLPLTGLIASLPTILAIERNAKALKKVAWINALTGWTVIGWFIAMVLAFSSEQK